MYTREELTEIAEVLRKHPQVVILSDDIYNRLTFDGSEVAPHLLHVAPDLADRTVVINGGSKAYSMTGWRIGWAIGPEKIIKAIGDYASQSTGAPSSISQKAAEVALENSEPDIEKTNDMLKLRLQSALDKFKEISEFKIFKPDGAFYLWINIEKALNKKYNHQIVSSSALFSQILLEDFFVATVPGEEFGHPGYLRLSFAIESVRFNQAVDRMKTLIQKMQ